MTLIIHEPDKQWEIHFQLQPLIVINGLEKNTSLDRLTHIMSVNMFSFVVCAMFLPLLMYQL